MMRVLKRLFRITPRAPKKRTILDFSWRGLGAIEFTTLTWGLARLRAEMCLPDAYKAIREADDLLEVDEAAIDTVVFTQVLQIRSMVDAKLQAGISYLEWVRLYSRCTQRSVSFFEEYAEDHILEDVEELLDEVLEEWRRLTISMHAEMGRVQHKAERLRALLAVHGLTEAADAYFPVAFYNHTIDPRAASGDVMLGQA